MKKKFLAVSMALMTAVCSCFSFFANASTGGNKAEEEMRKSLSPAFHEGFTEETVDIDLLKDKISDTVDNYVVDTLEIGKVTDHIFGDAKFIAGVVLKADGRDDIILRCQPIGASQGGEQLFRFSVKSGEFEKSQDAQCLLYTYDRRSCIPKCILYRQYGDVVNEKALSKIYGDVSRLTGMVRDCFDPAICWGIRLGSALCYIEDKVIKDLNVLSELSSEGKRAHLLKQHIEKRVFDCWLLHNLYHGVVMVEGNIRQNATMYNGFGSQVKHFAKMLYYYACDGVNK